ncbi:MAG TPA: peptide deformylase [Chloroflexota bacterium]|nr:peptide deformylase [Chloroflexota bacterium]
MARREIVTLGHPTLRVKAKKIHRVDESIKALVQDLIDTLEATPNGAGLAAPQIGVPLRAIVTLADGTRRVVINPEIVEESEEEVEGEEGCLSIPGWYGPVWRKQKVTVRGLGPSGKPLKVKTEDFEARVFQHEIDHLDGVLFVDRIEDRSRLHRVEPEEEASDDEDEVADTEALA